VCVLFDCMFVPSSVCGCACVRVRAFVHVYVCVCVASLYVSVHVT